MEISADVSSVKEYLHLSILYHEVADWAWYNDAYMRILIASDLHYPTISGVATFGRNLAKGLADRGHEVLVVAPSQTGKSYSEKDQNHTIVRTKSVQFPFYQNFRISINPAREVKSIIQEFKPDVIHIQMLLGIGQAVMRHGNKLGIPIVSTNHAMPENLMDNLKLLAPASRPINYILKAYGARFHAKADYVTLPTQSAIDMFNASDKISVPMEAVSNGIDLKHFKPGKAPISIYKKFNIDRNRKTVFYIGRLDAEKHLGVLIKAFAEVIKSKTDAQLIIVGSGTDQDNLKAMSVKYGIDNDVIFTGRVTDDEKIELLKIGTVFCMPSPAELQSIATLEAMASGQPVVAVDVGALGELCQDGRNGLLCAKDDYKQIAKSLTTILGDEDLRESYSKQSLDIASEHDLNTTLGRFEQIYSDLIK